MAAVPVHAVRRYSCDFETEAARSRWVVNPAVSQSIYNKLPNKWYIGEPGNNSKSGHYGLYVSDDGGQTAHYTNKGCWVFAYDTIALDAINGDYTLSFDYTVMANMASNFDGLYVLWIPMMEPGTTDSIKVLSIPTSDGTIPSTYENYVVPLQPTANMEYLNGTATWRQCAVKIKGSKCDGTPHYLAFVWANTSHQAQQPGAMVDNIFITDNEPCNPVTNLTITPNGTVVSLAWTGDAAEYEVSAYSYETDTWAGPKIVQVSQTTFSNLPIGQTDFIVRAKCDSDFYSLKTIVSKLIYYPDQMCVDYLNLGNAQCYVANSQPSDTRSFTDFRLVPAAVDYGPSNSSSRHTVHFDHNEVDPRTKNVAKTIPDGELASIRLGNWENKTGEGAEQIEFTFPIDTIKYPVLLLKYMPVIEAPNHDDHENSRFTLDILVDGVSIGRCGQADFNANDAYNRSTQQLKPGAADQGWHLVPPGAYEGSTTPVVWKEWTTVGVNIRKYAGRGRSITARLATYDCIYNAHYGYAYFTLGCSDGKLKGMKCGQINETFEAPDGFIYRWAYAYNERYRRPDGSLPEQYVLGHNQTYNAGYHDDSLYVVDCMFVQDSTCYFSLYASTLATNPIAKMAEPRIVKSCRENKYTITFDASPSWVQEVDHVKQTVDTSKTYHIESYEWMVDGLAVGNWSDEVTPTFTFPSTGGDYRIRLTTTCGTCDSTIYYDLHLDPLGPTHETRVDTLCDDVRKAGYEWSEKPGSSYKTYGLVDSVILYSETTSCDSIIYLVLHEPYRIYVDTMVLTDSLPFHFHGREYTKTMIDTIPFPTTCDSTWVLNFEVYEPIGITPTTFYSLCEGADSLTLEYDVYRGRSQSAWYSFIDAVKHPLSTVEEKKGHYSFNVPIDPNMEPDMYSGVLYFEDAKPEFNVTVPFSLAIHYSSALIAQRWNDVLAIRNDAAVKDTLGHRGYDYDFSAVQWYLDGQPIEGATQFNYYTGVGQHLLYGHEYTALLTRKRDGAQVFTCACLPEEVPGNMDVPQLRTLVNAAAQMPVSGRGTAYWYDTLGRLHHSDSYDNSYITAPAITGYYLVELRSGNNRSIHPVLVK